MWFNLAAIYILFFSSFCNVGDQATAAMSFSSQKKNPQSHRKLSRTGKYVLVHPAKEISGPSVPKSPIKGICLL